MPSLPNPGLPFREYLWNGPWVNARNWQRVTDPQASHPGSREFLPNPVNEVIIDDLDDAVGAEVCIEQWGGHAGTSAKAMQINGGPWITVPEPNLPAKERPENYQYFRYPTLSLPLERLRVGRNTFEFTSGPQVSYDFGWGQWGVYGVIFRIYYQPTVGGPSGSIRLSSATGTNTPVFTIQPAAGAGPLAKVDFIGYYEDFPQGGENNYLDWQFRYRYGQLQGHVGSAVSPPYQVAWDTSWVPEQAAQVKIVAKLTDEHGLSALTPELSLPFARADAIVRMYRPYDVPARWQTRAGDKHSCKVYIPDDLRCAVAARAVLVSWCGQHVDELGVNGRAIARHIGADHDYSFDEIDVPLAHLVQGENEFYTTAATPHHGIEVMWPGIVLKVKYTAR